MKQPAWRRSHKTQVYCQRDMAALGAITKFKLHFFTDKLRDVKHCMLKLPHEEESISRVSHRKRSRMKSKRYCKSRKRNAATSVLDYRPIETSDVRAENSPERDLTRPVFRVGSKLSLDLSDKKLAIGACAATKHLPTLLACYNTFQGLGTPLNLSHQSSAGAALSLLQFLLISKALLLEQ